MPSIPIIAQKAPVILPHVVMGTTSPYLKRHWKGKVYYLCAAIVSFVFTEHNIVGTYPTVVMVIIAHQKVPGMLLNCVSSASYST